MSRAFLEGGLLERFSGRKTVVWQSDLLFIHISSRAAHQLPVTFRRLTDDVNARPAGKRDHVVVVRLAA